jgi:hypothetical protein
MQRKDLDIFSSAFPEQPGHNSIAGGTGWRCRACLEIQYGCAYIGCMVLHSYRGRPLNAPAAFIHVSHVVPLMNRKLNIAILLIAAVPVCAQAQKPWVTKDDAQKVVTIISGDKAKIQTYCEIQELGEQMERAYEKRNLKLVDELLQKMDALEETLGPEYIALMDGLADIDLEKDKLGVEIMSVFDAFDRLCPR